MKNIYILIVFLLSFFIINAQTITNGSFEINDGITGWSGWNNATVSHSTAEGVSSLGAAKLINNSAGSSLVQVIPNPTFESGASTYRLQFKVKGTAGNKFRAVIIYTDPNNVITGDTYMTETTLGSDDWEEYHKESTLKAGYDGTELTLRLQGRTNGGTLYFDDVIFAGRNTHTWDGSASTDWHTAANWDLDAVPTNHTQVVIPSSGITNYPVISISGAKAGMLTLYQNAQLTINADADLTVASNIQSKGTITVLSSSTRSGSLIANGYSSTGTTTTDVSGADDGITYNKYVNAVGSPGWDMIGSPVFGETFTDIIGSLATSGSQFGVGPYNNQNNEFTAYTSSQASTAGTMSPGQGYQMSTSSGSTVAFNGYLNMSNVAYAITEYDGVGVGTQWNLVSNPFTSYICLNSAAASASSTATTDFLTYNSSTSDVLGFSAGEDVVYYWDGDSYETYSNSDTAKYIAPGQGFFISSENASGSSVVFGTSMQTHATTDDFIQGDAMDPDRAELFISLHQNDLQRQTKLFFLENMTDDLDSTYDGAVFGMQDNPIYSRLVSNDVGIDLSTQALLFSEINDKVIPLGINAEAGEEAIISISHNTTNPSTYVYLEDALEGTFTNLKETDFVITPDSNLEGVGRFFIHTTASTMSNEDATTNLLNVFKLDSNNFITVEGLSTQSNQTNLKLYNILGKEILSTTLLNNTNTQTISTEGLSTGIYVIKLESGNNLLTKKLIIK